MTTYDKTLQDGQAPMRLAPEMLWLPGTITIQDAMELAALLQSWLAPDADSGMDYAAVRDVGLGCVRLGRN
jgi:hypothetical protein